ncbi:MAG: AAA family ATPase [Bacillota bacterium]
MDSSITMQFVMMRAQAELAAGNGAELAVEHVFLGILKLAELQPKDITPKEKYHSGIKEDIRQVRALLSEAGIDSSRARGQLRGMLRSYRFPENRNIQAEMTSMMNTASQVAAAMGSEELTAAMALTVLLNDPIGVIGEIVPQSGNKAVLQNGEPAAEAAVPIPKSNEQTPDAASEMGLGFLPELTARIRTMRSKLLSTVCGQDHVVHAFSEGMFSAEVLAASDEKRRRPRAIFVFAGPPGVGKTFLAEQAAEALSIPYKRFDMSSFSDHQSYMNLIGFERSYQGAKPGTLTGFVKQHPHSILLFDEIEKAHLNTIHLFLQILDAGRLSDKYMDEDVSFKDTIIIFTSNAGRSLYEGDAKQNAAGIPRKTILNALETEKNPQTGQPFFPAAITSRMATGWPLLFNHLQANDLEKISAGEFKRFCELFHKQYGITVSADDLLASTLLFAEGGQADARTLRAQTELFFKNEIFKLCRLFNVDSFLSVLERLDSLRFEVDAVHLSADVLPLFQNNEKAEILIFGTPWFADACKEKLPGFVFYQTTNRDEALKIAGEKDIRLVLLDLSTRDETAAKNDESSLSPNLAAATGTVNAFDFAPMAAASIHEGNELFSAIRERLPELPVYLLETELFKIDSELLMSFVRAGARGKLSAPTDDFTVFEDELEDICKRMYMQSVAARMAGERKVLYFETAPKFTPDKKEVVIRVRDLQLKRALAAEDAGEVLTDAEKPNIRFADVIGAGEAKEELQFFINYLKNPKKFSAQGLKPPKGILLYGPPGTGKTLLAKAMAGESGVAFIPAVASSFVTKYQGSGPESVRALFKKARRYAPAIIFIDEIDAVGRTRGGSDSAHGEEMALNALLTEMDGFSVDPKRPVFVLAATNFDVEEGKGGMGTIDAALARRFDRKIMVDLPNKDDRRQYIEMMLKKNKTHIVTEQMIERLAGRSTGMSLANMASVLELANRMAVKQNKPLDDALLDEAFELSRFGAEKNWGHEYLERVARHESGHAFLCYLGGNTPSYLTIVARGGHGGYMEHSDQDMGPLQTKEDLISRIRVSLGGRAAEIVYYGEKDGVSTGASGDLEQATRVARAMICNYGMDDEFGMAVMSAEEATRGPLAAKVSERVSAIIRDEMKNTVEIIAKNKHRMDRMVNALLEKNKLTREEMEALLDQE